MTRSTIPREPASRTGTVVGRTCSAPTRSGRDILSRLIYGAKVSMYTSFGIVLIALLVVAPARPDRRLLPGRRPTRVDLAGHGRAVHLPAAAPRAHGRGAPRRQPAHRLCIAIAIPFIPGLVRIIRGQVLSAREESYIEASRSRRSEQPAHHRAPRAAQRRVAAHRAGRRAARLRAPRRGRSDLPRPRVGRHDARAGVRCSAARTTTC